TASPTASTPSLHDALPIFVGAARSSEPEHVLSELTRGQVSLASFVPTQIARLLREEKSAERLSLRAVLVGGAPISETLRHRARRSEEHTSELQSRENLVCR